MLQVPCPNCQQIIHYDGPRPSFCSYCGQRLSTVAEVAVAEAEAPTLPPSNPSQALHDAPTVPPSGEGTPITETIEVIGGYRLLKRLGGGGMGTVYEAEDASGRRVALKLISGQYASSPAAVKRFQQEGKLASTMAHPRCVFVLAADEDRGRPYIVMELMPGETLGDLVHTYGPLSVRVAVEKILDVIDGLQEAHQRGIIHRDVKPSNCFLEADGRVKVGDFGLAKTRAHGLDLDAAAHSHAVAAGTPTGEPRYPRPLANVRAGWRLAMGRVPRPARPIAG